MIRASAPACLHLLQVAIAIRVLVSRFNQPCFNRVLSNVLPVSQEALLIVSPRLGKAALPDFSQILAFPLQAIREPAFDELHGFFNRHISLNRQENMRMIGHDHEIVQKEFPLRNA